jgi:hypothetical protein
VVWTVDKNFPAFLLKAAGATETPNCSVWYPRRQ